MAIYFHYMYLLRLNNKNPYIKLTPEMKADIAKMHAYYDGIRIISENTIIPGKILAIGNQQFRLEFSIK